MPTTSTKHASARSSANPIHGNPDFIYGLDELARDFDKDLAKTLRGVLTQTLVRLRETARRDPFWAKYEDLLGVRFAHGEIQYTLTGPTARVKEAYALEYGTGAEPPRSLFRKVSISEGNQIPATLAKKLKDDVVPHGR